MHRLSTNEAFLDFIFRFGIGALLVGLGLLALRLLLLFISVRTDARDERAADEWRRILAVPDVTGPVPLLTRRTFRLFAPLWLDAYTQAGSLATADAKRVRERLCEMARRAEAARQAEEEATRGHFRDRTIAAQLLGHLGGNGAWTTLERLSLSEHAHLALLGLQGLLRIDAPGAAPLVVRRIEARPDWPDHTLQALLDSVGGGAATVLVEESRRQAAALGSEARRLRLSNGPGRLPPPAAGSP